MRFEIFPSQREDEIVVLDREKNTATIMPRRLSWQEVSSLPTGLATALNEWSNSVEYGDASCLLSTDTAADLPGWVRGMGAGFGIAPEERIIDFGTGTGAIRLGFLRDGYRNTIGVDVSADCLRRQAAAAVRLGLSTPGHEESHLLTLADLHSRLDAYARTVSLVILHSALHHFADLAGLFALCKTLLRKGGKFVALNEPINKNKWRYFDGATPREIDLFEVATMAARGERRKTESSTLLAEFWDGIGFSRPAIESLLHKAGMTLVSWEPNMWLSQIFHHAVRNNLGNPNDSNSLAEFEKIYSQILSIEERIRPMVTKEFRESNFFTVNIVAERTE